MRHNAPMRRFTLTATFALCLGLAPLAEAASPIAWEQGIAWVPFDKALSQASTENKAVCVVVYADWCPKCRALAPRFAEETVKGASKDLVMVLQNSDDKPEWLRQRFGDLGNYVPRVFFLKPDGSVDRDITSGNQRFPYFYRANETDKLVASMNRAVKAAGPARVAPPQPPAAPAASAPAAPPAPPAPAPATSTGLASGSDLPILALLAALAIGAVWFVGRNGESSQ